MICVLDGPISYTIPQGERRGFDVQFSDETYDGILENGTLKSNQKKVLFVQRASICFIDLSDGLGQLTDGILAGDDYRLAENVQGIGQTGYDWIGWKRRSSLNLYFHFQTIENLTSIRLHTSNLFTRDIYQFKSISVTCCHHSRNQTYRLIPDDERNIQARFINVSLQSGSGFVTDCLKVTLTFHNRSKWILISEVLFDIEPVTLNQPLFTTSTKHHPIFLGKSTKDFLIFEIKM